MHISSNTDSLDNTSITLHDTDEVSYVKVTHAKLNNIYVMYQNHSKQYPKNIHCEAKTDDKNALWLCEKALHGTKIENGSLTSGYTTFILQGDESDGTFAVDYVDRSGITLRQGDTCTATKADECQHINASGSTCTSSGVNGCSNSAYTADSTCTSSEANGCSNSTYTADSSCQATGANGGCTNSSYDGESSCSTINGGKQGCASSQFSNNSTCTAGQEGGVGTKPVAGCQQSIFTAGSTCVVNQNIASNAVDTACGGNDKGGKEDTTGANSAQYYGSECINESVNSFGCGRSWYKEGSICTSNRTNGGCGNSLFDASRCIGRGGNACDKSKFTNGSVCEAQKSGTCPINQSTYDSTSYCAGENNSQYSYCPAGTPAPPTTPGGSTTGRTWRACTSEDGAPKSGMSCYDD